MGYRVTIHTDVEIPKANWKPLLKALLELQGDGELGWREAIPKDANLKQAFQVLRYSITSTGEVLIVEGS